MKTKLWFNKILVTTLILSLAFGNTIVVFAQTSSSTFSNEASLEEEQPEQIDLQLPNGGDFLTLLGEPSTDDIPSFIRQAGTNGKVNSPDSNTLSGAFTYDYRLTLPPGRNGMTPDLTLSYSNQNHSETDVFGYGWDISIPYIERRNVDGFDGMYSIPSHFYSTMSGELISTSTLSTTTVTLYPDADPESTAFDGYTTGPGALYQWPYWSYATFYFSRDLNSPNVVLATSTTSSLWLRKNFDGYYDYITRGYFLFDTSAIPDYAKILSSTFSIYSNGVNTGEGTSVSTSLNVTGVITGSTTDITADDHHVLHFGSTKLSDTSLNTSSWAAGYKDFVLNNPGVAEIKKSGITSLSLRTVPDIDNQDPYFDNGRAAYAGLYFADQSGTSNDPKLVVNYNASFPETYTARNDDGSFLQYTFQNNSWAVRDKNGTSYVFGTSTDGRIVDPNNSNKVSRWMLQQVTDSNGNTITYTYSKDSSQIYPESISYTGINGSGGIFSVDFTKSLRSTSTATTTATSFEIKNRYKIDEIIAKINGGWVRKYELDYDEGDNGSRLLLKSITETGQAEGGGTITLPSTNFDYSPSTRSWSSLGWSFPTTNFAINDRDQGVKLVDINGDGLGDLVKSFGNGTSTTTSSYINDGSSWDLDASWVPPCLFSFKDVNDVYWDGSGRLLDVNGDFLPDFICNNTIHLNTGSGWATSTEWKSPEPISIGNKDAGVRFGDLNGDGLVDMVRGYKDETDYTHKIYNKHVYINTGYGWTADIEWDVPTYFTSFTGGDLGSRLEDVNGDGLVDLLPFMASTSTPNTVMLNTGSGWATSTTWTLPINVSQTKVRFADFNNDNLIDIGVAAKTGSSWDNNDIYLNTGSGWALVSSWDFSVPFTQNGMDAGTRFGDIDGDGVLDILTEGSGTYGSSWSINQLYTGNGIRPDNITRVDESRGGSITVTYKGSSEYRDGSNNILNPNLPISLSTVQKLEYFDGISATSTQSFEYEGGSLYYNNPFDRRLAGFNITTKSEENGDKVKMYFHQGNDTDSSLGEYLDDQSKIGRAYRVETLNANDDLYSVTISQWDSSDLGGGVSFAKLARLTDLTYDGDTDHKDKAETYFYATTTGSLLQKIEWGEVTASTNGSFTDTGSDKRTTDITYAASSTGYVILPSNNTIKDQSDAKIAENKFYYDNLSLGSVSKGNLTKQESWKSDTAYIDIEKTYNSYGLATQSIDPRDKITTYTYDTHNLYPATTTNPLSQSTGYAYDYSSGKVIQTIDPNGNIFQTTLDPLDRVTEEKQPDLITPSTLVTKATYVYTDNSMPRVIQKTLNLDESTSTANYTFLDGFGRKVEERTRAEDTNTYSVKNYSYDFRGNLKNESLPFFGTGTSYSGSVPSNNLLVNYTYDSLKRVASIANSVGTTTNTYDDWKLTVTDPNGEVKHLYKDAYGRLIKVEEINGGSTYATNYEYNANNNLTKITDSDTNIRNFTYDGLGRRLTAQDLHDQADGTYGTWTYVYDDAGNIASSTDPKSQIVEYTYDDLSRVLTENYTGQGGTEISYGYDFCVLGKGKLCAATTTDSVTKPEYNSLGIVKKETRTINSTDYVTHYSYNRLGALTSVIYPDNSEVAYTYNSGGTLEKVEQKENGGEFKSVLADLDYAPTGKVTFKNFGNGVTSTYTYDADKIYRLTNIFTAASSTEAGGGLGLLNYPNFKKLFADIGNSSTGTFSLLAFNSFSRLALEALNEFSIEEQPNLIINNPAIEEIIEDTLDSDLIVPALLDEAATTTIVSESVATTTEPVATSTSSSEDMTGTTTIISLDPVATSTATTTDLVATTTLETLVATTSTPATIDLLATSTPEILVLVATSTATSTGLVDETFKVKNDKAGRFADNDDNYEFIFTQKSKDVGKASAKAMKNKPEIRLTKWDGQVDVGVSYKKVKGNGSYKSSSDRIEWKDDKEELHAYPLPATKEMEGGGFEIEVYLKDKPDTNVFDFEIDGAENLDFFFQPELTEEEKDLGAIRPENVVGSYAVYHKTKRNYEIGGMNYETGKIFHIFRPRVIDASGNEAWGTLSYENRTLSVTVPQEFLDKADYPVRVDPTFGYTSVGASGGGLDYSAGSDGAVGDEYNLPIAGTVQSITAHAGTFNAPNGRNGRFILTSGGTSSTLQAVTASFPNDSQTRVWITKNFSSPVSLSSGDYILGFQGDDRDIALSYDSVAGAAQYNTGANFGASPGSGITWSNVSNWKFSIYATYTTGSSNWQYRKPITINGATDAGNNYQVLLKVGESSGASGENFDLGGHAQSFPTAEGSGADLMFTRDDGYTEINFWVEYVTGTAPNRLAYVWVKVPDDLSDNKNIYVYYGNPGALKSSNGEGTFNFFDDFDDGVIDHQKWTSICSSGCDVTSGSSSSITESGDTLKQFDAAVANSQSRLVASSSPFNTDGYAVRRRFKRTDDGTYANSTFGFTTNTTSHTNNGTTSPVIHSANFENRVDLLKSGYSTTLYNSDLTQNTWYKEEALRDSESRVTGFLWTDSYSQLGGLNIQFTPSITDSVYTTLRSGDGHDVETDWVFVRRFETTEPSFSSAGSEEYLGQAGGGEDIGMIQNISYTYDNVGNIISITDHSSTGAGKILSFGYDDLHRLTHASTTAASSTPFLQTFSYSSIGNMTGMKTNTSATSTYSYAETGLTNPHAPTSIGGTTLGYDNNGNLLTYGSKSYSWDYRNRLASSTESGANTIYTYDHTEQRVKKTNGATTTIYPNKYYEVSGATSTRYIWAGDELVATISGGTSTTTSYIHPDHLGSTNATTNMLGYTAEVLDYYPYGSERFATGTPEVSRTYIGEFSDSESDLSYLNARYYDGARAGFLSQDPVFWEINHTEDGKKVLQNPQAQNSYSYAQNNPIVNKDPTGRVAFVPIVIGVFYLYNAVDVYTDYLNYRTTHSYPGQFSDQERYQAKFELGLDATLAIAGAPLKGAKAIMFEALPAALDVMDNLFGDQIYKNINSRNKNSSNSIPFANHSTNYSLQQSGSAYGKAPSANSIPNSAGNIRLSGASSALSSASNSLSAASAALSRGDFAGASRHLQNATRFIGGIK